MKFGIDVLIWERIGGMGAIIRRVHRLSLMASFSVLLLIVLSFAFIAPFKNYTLGAEATAGISNPSITTLVISSNHNAASVNATVMGGNGTFASSDANSTAVFTVNTNNYTGYELSIVGSDDDGKLADHAGNFIDSIDDVTSEADFSGANNTTYNNKWGFKPNKYVSNNTVIDNTGANQVFLPAPTTTPLQLDKTTVANNDDNEYTLGLGLRVDLTAPSGVYANTFTLIALANPVVYNVTFNKNAYSDDITNMPTNIEGSTSSTGINIPNTIPQRPNFTFVGWCDKKEAINTCPTGGLVFLPGETYGLDHTIDNAGITLYAMWQPNYYMQDVAEWGGALEYGHPVQAIDRRDGKIYWVGKFITDAFNPRAEIDTDGNYNGYQIWMMSSLDLDLDSSKTYTHADTDLGWSTNDESATWTPLRSTVTALDSTTWLADNNTPYSYDSGKYYYAIVNSGNSEIANYEMASLEQCVVLGVPSEVCNLFRFGNYYNWSAAVASNDTSTMVDDYIDAPNSICPAGWRLPSGNMADGTASDYGYLLSHHGIITHYNYGTRNEDVGYEDGGLIKFITDPLYMAQSGRIKIVDGAPSVVTVFEDSYYWESTAFHASNAYALRFYQDNIRPLDSNAKSGGFAVRCVARPPKSMQNVGDWEDELEIGDTAQAADVRDNKVYWVTKEETDTNNPRAEIDEASGQAYQIWMTQNLDYHLSTIRALLPTDSDVSSSWTPLRSTLANSDSSSWVADDNTPYSYDAGSGFMYTSNSTSDDTYYSAMIDCVHAGYNKSECRHYQVGNLYNWSAAIASNDSTNAPFYSNLPDSICPAGWRLPAGAAVDGDSSDFDYLLYQNEITSTKVYNTTDVNAGYATNGFNKVRLEPIWGVQAGNILDNQINNVGTRGYYWSGLATTSQYARGLSFGVDVVYPSYGSSRDRGFSVRCVARKSIDGISSMQDFSDLSIDQKNDVVKSMIMGEQYEVEDSRDGNVYTIAKLPDGTVWMTKHLDLAGGTTLTPADSNVPNNYTLPASDYYGFDEYYAENVYNSNNTTCGETDPCYSYYSYPAATAGTNPDSGFAAYDICPKGWRLPSATEFGSLVSMYSSPAAIQSSPWNGVLSGRMVGPDDDDVFIYSGTYASLWSSYVRNSTMANNISYGDGTVNTNVGYYGTPKGTGFSLRCVLDITTISDISTMQEFDNLTPIARQNVLESMKVGRQYVVLDSRDNNEYTISRLNDGAVWMTKNLDLAGGTALYSDTSNVPGGYLTSGGTPYYTLPSSNTNGFDNDATAFVYNSGSTTCDNNQPCYSYYSYLAATAGAGAVSGDASYDICPKGWRLPIQSEYEKLADMYSTGDIITALPWKGVYAGAYYNNSLTNGGVSGYYWSSTIKDTSYSQELALMDSLATVFYGPKASGYSVRCILNTSLQDATADLLGLLIPNNEDSTILSDKRDNEKYSIARISDGSIWMTKNLNLAGGTTITPYDSNVTTNYTLPNSSLTGFTDDDTQYVYNSGRVECTNDRGCYSYYSYLTAVAGTNPSTGSATSDICPKGWYLPTNDDYSSLFSVYPSGDLLAPVWKTVYSGHVNNNAVSQVTTYSYYWTSTVDSGNPVYSYRPWINPTEDGVARGVKASGYPIRCVKSY